MKQRPKGQSRKLKKGKTVKRKAAPQSKRPNGVVRNVSETLEVGFAAAFKRIVRRIALIRANYH
jgi:hypothetical protein